MLTVCVCVCVSQEKQIILNRKKKFKNLGSRDFNCDFEFGERDVLNDDDWVMADVMKQLKNKVVPVVEPVEQMLKYSYVPQDSMFLAALSVWQKQKFDKQILGLCKPFQGF